MKIISIFTLITLTVSVELGGIRDSANSLADEPLSTFRYHWTKEVYPHLEMGAGYQLRYGGLEGFICPDSMLTQE